MTLIMKTNLFYGLLFLTLIYSCTNDDVWDGIESTNIHPQSGSVLSDFDTFSKILSKAVSNNSDLRAFIKEEALKMTDNDYDVFYPLVKNKKVTADKTFKEVLKDYDFNNSLDAVEERLPLLTIYIPELPSGFNAENWNSFGDSPYVCTNLVENDSISFYFGGDLHFKLESDLVPGFPVLVLKNNERIVKTTNTTRSNNPNIINEDYSFVDSAFDGINKREVAVTRASEDEKAMLWKYNYSTEHIRLAYKEMGVNDGLWQRDNIYYGLNRNNTEGEIKRNIIENIACLHFSTQALYKIADQTNDPKFYQDLHWSRRFEKSSPKDRSFWGEGRFEFKIDVLIGNTSGLGSVITKYFSVEPWKLFHLTWDGIPMPRPSVKDRILDMWVFKVTGSVPYSYNPDIDLIGWDLESNSVSWKFDIYEVDEQEVFTTQEKVSTEFAGNVGLNVGIGKKVGLNFGGSAKKVKENTFTKVMNKGSDHLGTLEVNFYDPILKNNRSSRDIENYYSAKNPMVEMTLIPKKIY